MLRNIRPKHLDAPCLEDRADAPKEAAAIGFAQHDVDSIVAPAIDGIDVGRNVGTFPIPEEIKIERHRNGGSRQKQLLVTSLLSTAYPPKPRAQDSHPRNF